MKKLTRTVIDQRKKTPRKLGRPPKLQGQKAKRKINPDKLPANAGEVGRPTAYTKELGDRICEAIATTTMPLPKLCDSYKEFPTPTMLYRWLRKYDEFREAYRIARFDQTLVLADQLIELADTERLGQMVIQKEDGSRYIRVGDMTGRTKIQISARQWLLARLDPKKWGAKLDVTDSTNPLKALADGWEKRYREITNGESVDPTESDGPVAPTAA